MHDNSTGTGRTPDGTENGAAPCARRPNQSSEAANGIASRPPRGYR